MPTKKKTPAPVPEVPATLVVTGVQVYPIKEPLGKTRAFARVVLNDQLQLTGLRVVDGVTGLFVSYPNDPSYRGEDFRSLFFPLIKDLRNHIEEVVLKAYADATSEKVGA